MYSSIKEWAASGKLLQVILGDMGDSHNGHSDFLHCSRSERE